MPVIINGTTGITDVNGTAAAPAITGTDTDTGIFFPAANTLAFSTNGTEDARFDASGNLSVGTTSVDGKLTLQESSAGLGAAFYSSSGNSAGVIGTTNEATTSNGLNINSFRSGGKIVFTVASSERMRLDASGNLGIGTTSPSSQLQIYPSTANVFTEGLRVNRQGQTGQYAIINYSAGIGRFVAVDSLFNSPSLGFFTSSDGSTQTERARIDSSGSLFVGTSTTWLSSAAYKQGGLQVGNASYAAIVGQAGGTARYGIFYDAANTYLTVTSGGTFYVYNTTNGVYLSANATSWTSNSDERLKDIIEPITNAASKVSTLRAVIGKYKSDADGTRRSFLIAQDVQAVLPEAVSESQSKDQEETYLGLQYTEVIPLLVAAIKEQQAIITQLQADIETLKGKA